MAGQVAVHVALLIEAPPAEGAEERLLPGVGQKMALDSARVAEDLGADVTFLLAQRKMDQLTAHAQQYVFPRWLSLLKGT
jgi:hypothetical protein